MKGLIKRIINDNILSEGLKWDNLDEYWEFRRFGRESERMAEIGIPKIHIENNDIS